MCGFARNSSALYGVRCNIIIVIIISCLNFVFGGFVLRDESVPKRPRRVSHYVWPACTRADARKRFFTQRLRRIPPYLSVVTSHNHQLNLMMSHSLETVSQIPRSHTR